MLRTQQLGACRRQWVPVMAADFGGPRVPSFVISAQTTEELDPAIAYNSQAREYPGAQVSCGVKACVLRAMGPGTEAPDL